ncbi:hypothetical protein [Actinomycetospora termitidis]|uniref:Uncharacterized protein n=1 Tax=Actinomycetospora termitidis TaxID=3053470 RepID=A0ABT7MJ53_9PSEU|nr:hypothetical protein [Actinomycetospora sp. Odt1-22]MDL5159388.1 hypothetical protein [Actinomycetospora sp. Odt1-22]
MSIVEGFSLSHVQLLDGTESFRAALHRTAVTEGGWDVYGVREASLDVDDDDWANEGDDDTLSRWQWINYVEIEVLSGYFGFKTYERLTGRPTVVTGSGASTSYRADLWHELDNNLPPCPLLLKLPARDTQGRVRDFVIGIYRFQLGPLTFEGPEYKEGLGVSYTGSATKTAFDERGQPFPDGKRRCAVVLSFPGGDPDYVPPPPGAFGTSPFGTSTFGGQ